MMGLMVPNTGWTEKNPYVANAVHFDGAATYLTRGGGLTGAVDSKLFTYVQWVNWTGPDSSLALLYNSDTFGGASGNALQVQRDSANNWLRIAAPNLNIHSTNDIKDVGWVCIMASIDRSDIGKVRFYFNDVDEANIVTHTNATMDFTVADWSIGAAPNGAADYEGDMADFFFWPSVYADFSVEANRRLFIDDDGKPVDPDKPSGAVSTFGTPTIRLTDPTATWHLNRGTGGGFNESNALTDASSPSL